MRETQTVSSLTVRPRALSPEPATQVAAASPHPDSLAPRHIGPGPEDVRQMLETLGRPSLGALVAAAIPAAIGLTRPLQLPPPETSSKTLARLKAIAAQNQVFRSYLGMGYADCVTPPVLQRNVLENPGWYTPYTPYQAEISQGRLEALLNFQTLITDLTGLDIANASLLDEATAAAEAMAFCHRLEPEAGRKVFFISELCHPQTVEVVRTRARSLGLESAIGNHATFTFDETVFGALVQYPDTYGTIWDYRDFVDRAHGAGARVAVASDLLSLVLLVSPGEFGADVAVGSAQRFGVPLGYGGPHAAYFATRDACKRQMPGRIVGVSRDSRGRPALRLALGTREQHIRRDKATSNICTAQALLATVAAMYAAYHGPDGLKAIAGRIHALAGLLARALEKLGFTIANSSFFDTIRVELGAGAATELAKAAQAARMNFRVIGAHGVGIALDESCDEADVGEIVAVFNGGRRPDLDWAALAAAGGSALPAFARRASPFLRQPVFNLYHSETEMMRYLRRLESRDLSLAHSMIPLGSCTMKLNAAAEMFPLTWPEFNRLHPFVPLRQAQGYQLLFQQLEEWLAEVTGYAAVSLQPNAGSQGEYAGLLVIRAYHASRGEGHRKVCLIPQSAHGTNPASAVLAGLTVVGVACDPGGNIDLADLRAKTEAHRGDLAALMVTYPSTHGVFEEGIKEIIRIAHEAGGQVYLDGANLNALVGLCRPGELGADVGHVNLHKTFCIPHGGGGPGMGPIGVAEHLIPFLPDHPVVKLGGEQPIGPVAAAPWGSAGILPISWVYIAAMGGEGLTHASQVAILNANYVAQRLAAFFPVLYTGKENLVAHECILDLRRFKKVTAEDVAKRLIDYGFHAPTLSWPVPGTLMVEPTESESRAELDRFCDAMIAIHAEILAIETGQAHPQNNLLKNAPHTADMVAADTWDHPYSREQAAYPLPWLRERKFWPAVGRVDSVYGDRNPVCTCAGPEELSGLGSLP